jgi:multiple sugar transport system substrate-binding protein
MIPEQQQRQKAVIEFNSGNTSFDVIAISYHVQKRLFGKNKWLDDVRPDDGRQVARRSQSRFRRFRAGRAHLCDASRRPHRQPAAESRPVGRLLQQGAVRRQGHRVSEDFARMVDAAARINDPAKGVSGFVARGLKNANVPVWSSFLLGYGGAFIDAKGKLMTDTAEAVEAAKMYQTLLAKYGPQGVAGFNWNESQSLFLQGKACDVARRHRFRAAARGSDQIAHRRQGGLRRHAGRPEGAGLGAVRRRRRHLDFSKKKGPSWFYLQWASNKANQTRMLQAAAGAPVRNSAYAAAQSSSDFKAPKQWVECMLTSARIAQPGLPVIAPVTEFRDVFGIALTNMINGADPAAELKKATAEFQPVLDKSEKA